MCIRDRPRTDQLRLANDAAMGEYPLAGEIHIYIAGNVGKYARLSTKGIIEAKIRAIRTGEKRGCCIKKYYIAEKNVLTLKDLKSMGKSMGKTRSVYNGQNVAVNGSNRYMLSYIRTLKPASCKYERTIITLQLRPIKPIKTVKKMEQHPGYFTAAGEKAKQNEPTFSEDEDQPDKEIPYTPIPWPTSLWKMEADWKPVFQAPHHASTLDPRAQVHIPIAERLASRLSVRKDLRILKPRVIPLERLGERETDEARLRDQAARPTQSLLSLIHI